MCDTWAVLCVYEGSYEEKYYRERLLNRRNERKEEPKVFPARNWTGPIRASRAVGAGWVPAPTRYPSLPAGVGVQRPDE